MADYIGVGNPVLARGAKPADYKLGPFSSVSEACSKIAQSFRYIGMTVIINNNNVATEYWFKNGTTDSDLVAKQTGGGGDGFKAIEVVSISEDTTTVLEEYYTNGEYNMVVATSTEKAYIRYGEGKWFSFAVGILSSTPSSVVGISEVNYLSMT